MKNKKIKKQLEVYGLIGKVLTGCAGGIVGFVVGGPFLAVPGVIVGIVGGHLFQKATTKKIA
ncbi:MAG TPA: hypothetical protein VI564_02040 [Candidatus Nanoarchaeia archaeon]|nr:hypothetical protein [Candidatus Nanoarchaeia archaeon]